MPPAIARQVLLAALLLGIVAVVAPASLPWATLGVLLWMAALLLRRKRHGVEGRLAQAVGDLDPHGNVVLDGVVRRAEGEGLIVAGEFVRVLDDEDGVLRVSPVGVRSPLARVPRRLRLR